MISTIAVIIIVLATAGFVFLSCTLMKSFNLLVSVLIAAAAAFGLYETAARLIIGYGFIVSWASGLALLLIFALTALILYAISDQLVMMDYHFGDLGDKVLRVVIGSAAGFIGAGVIMTAAAMLPIGAKWPYQRFAAEGAIRPSEPDKTLILNADGFAASLGSMMSKGSMSTKKSFAVFHPELINEIHLNRMGDHENNLSVAGSDAVRVESARLATGELTDKEGRAVSFSSDRQAVIVRASLSSRKVKDGGMMPETGEAVFTMAQLRLICKEDPSDLGGSGSVVYPAGYLDNSGNVVTAQLTETVVISDFSGGKKEYDFVFYIPKGTSPVMLQLKSNAVDSIDKLLTGEDVENVSQ